MKRIMSAVMILLTLSLLLLGNGCSSKLREVGHEIYDARIDSILYETEYSQPSDDPLEIKVYFANPKGNTLLGDGGMWVYNESGTVLQAGHTYHLVLRVMSKGWGPIYYLEEAVLLE